MDSSTYVNEIISGDAQPTDESPSDSSQWRNARTFICPASRVNPKCLSNVRLWRATYQPILMRVRGAAITIVCKPDVKVDKLARRRRPSGSLLANSATIIVSLFVAPDGLCPAGACYTLP